MESLPLSAGTIDEVGNRIPGLELPRYLRQRDLTLPCAHMHVGPSSFFLAAIEQLIDDLARKGEDWGTSVASLRTPETTRLLREQDMLHTVTTVRCDGPATHRVMGSIRDAYFAHPDQGPQGEREQMFNSLRSAKVVSFTVTANGWPSSGCTPELNRDASELDRRVTYRTPKLGTALGLMAWRVIQSWDAQEPPPVFLVCENAKKSGPTALGRLIEFLDPIRRDLAIALESEAYPVRMPIVMADRIVAEGRNSINGGNRSPTLVSAQLHEKFGVRDRLALLAEDHLKVVIGALDQDRQFVPGTEALRCLGEVGVEFSTAQEALEAQIDKMLFVNGNHTGYALLGAVMGELLIDRTASDGRFEPLLAGRNEEVLRVRRGVGTPLPHEFNGGLRQRFCNNGLRDSVTRVGREISDKVVRYFMETVRLALAMDFRADHSIKLIALWIYYLYLESISQAPIKLHDGKFDAVYGSDWRKDTPAALRVAALSPSFERMVQSTLEARQQSTPVFPGSVIADSRFIIPFAHSLRDLFMTADVGRLLESAEPVIV